MTRRNEGVIVTGGRIEAGALAVGRGAHASQAVHRAAADLAERGRTEVADRLEALIRELEQHAGRLDNADELKESTEVVARELAKDEPNRTTVTGVLAGITAGVQSITSVAAAAQALAALF
jgi:hypothetical protein